MIKRRIKKLRKQLKRYRQIYKIITQINKYGDWGVLIYNASKSAGISPALGAALVEKESAFKNIFGCDYGSGVAFCHEQVTKAKVEELMNSGKRNGIGPTQLTSYEYVIRANERGGSWKPRHNISVGFEILSYLIERNGKRKGIGAYNGGEGNPQYDYADDIINIEKKWEARFS